MKRTMLFAALAAAALARTARAEDVQETKKDAAEEVQKAKRDAAEKKAEAQKDAREAQADTSQKAAEARQDARKEAREADQNVAEAKQDAAKDVREAQRDQSHDRDHDVMANRGEHKRHVFEGKNNFDVDGRVQRVSPNSITIAREELPPVTLRIEKYTAIEVDGNKAARTQLRQGQDVKASFNLNGDKPVALDVKAETKK